MTVDSITDDWPRVDVIKIDVEGAEESVWAGNAADDFGEPRADPHPRVQRRPLRRPSGFRAGDQVRGVPAEVHRHDAEVKDVTVDELLTRQVGDDWMLYLARR